MIRYTENYRKKHRDRPLRYWFMPPVMNEGFRTLPDDDPPLRCRLLRRFLE